jgi:DNA-3-methyladenine glycosylase I
MAVRRRNCCWPTNDPLMIRYHDTEWGVPLHDDRKLFEFLVLEGMQAGLSWSTILNKRENFRAAFDGFDPRIVACYGGREIQRLLEDSGIVRNQLKINGAITNARCFLEVQEEFGSFDAFIWDFIGGKPIKHRFKTIKELPPTTAESDLISKELKKRGFKFVGSTIVYAQMQATGMVNDHIVDCVRYLACK